MESTLSVTDLAFNSGRRSRANSFNSQEVAPAVLQDQVLSPDPHNPPFTDAFKTHRRQASDLSDAGGPLAVSPSILSLPLESPFDRHSPVQQQQQQQQQQSQEATNLFRGSTEGEQELDEAFNSLLFMREDYAEPQAASAEEMSALLEQKRFLYAMNQQYQQDMARQFIPSAPPETQNFMAYDDGNGLRQGMQGDATFDMYDARYSLNHGQSPYDTGGVSMHQQHQQHQHQQQHAASSLHDPESQVSVNFDLARQAAAAAAAASSASLHSSPSWPRQKVQSPPLMLEVPGRSSIYSSSLDVTSPYSDAPSFEASSSGDHGSPAHDPHALSRSNSFHSQYSPHLDACLVSAPVSPFIAQENFVEGLVPENFMAYQKSAYQSLTPAQQYELLRSNHALRQQQQQQQQNAYLGVSPMPIPQSETYGGFEAPDISINPPTPGGASYMNRAQQQKHYPFPQQVPIITTTTAAPTTFDEMHEMDFQTPGTLGVDRQRQQRGRSHSDSRLMVHHNGQTRSHSRSSIHSSSSRSNSRVRGSPISIRTDSSRVSKPSPGSHHGRRASWSGVGDDTDATEEETAGTSPSHSRQKNAATFICPVEGCGKAFTRAYNLRSHQRTHTNERPFLCEICSKGFARQHDRKRHEKLHSNEKPHSCPGCLKKFARMDALSRHFKSEMGKDCIVGNPDYEHFLLDDET